MKYLTNSDLLDAYLEAHLRATRPRATEFNCDEAETLRQVVLRRMADNGRAEPPTS